jgi:long-chain fatty acid transport protein
MNHGFQGRLRSTLASVAALLALFIGHGAPHASPLLELSGGVSEHPFMSAHMGSDVSVVYSNPALLLSVRSSSLFGVMVLGQSLTLDLDARSPGSDITEAVYKARLIGEDGLLTPLQIKPLATSDLVQPRGSFDSSGTAGYLVLGSTIPLVADRVVLGFQITLPMAEFERQSPFFVDEREQFFSNSLHFEMLEDRLEGNAIAFALAGRLLPSLCVGVGASMVTLSEANSDVFIGDPSYSTGGNINPNVRINTLFVPHGGLTWEPTNAWRIQATAHLAGGHEVKGTSNVQLWSYPYPEGETAIAQDFSMVYRYQPLRLGLGLRLGGQEASDGSRPWEVALGARWSQWSTYLDRQGESPSDTWSDTLEISAGGGLQIGHQRLGLDLRYTPTPVPDQIGRSSYVDNDRLGLGASWSVPVTSQWRLGLQGQAQVLLSRSTAKSMNADTPVIDEFPDSADLKTGDLIPESQGLQTNSPGFPGFFSEGWIWTGGLVLRRAL